MFSSVVGLWNLIVTIALGFQPTSWINVLAFAESFFTVIVATFFVFTSIERLWTKRDDKVKNVKK